LPLSKLVLNVEKSGDVIMKVCRASAKKCMLKDNHS